MTEPARRQPVVVARKPRPVVVTRAPRLAFIVHDLRHAEGALRAARASGVPVTLWSAPGAGDYAGLGFLGAVFDQAAAAVPEAAHDVVVDCGANAVLAHEALRRGFAGVVFSGRGRMRAALDAVAAAQGGRLIAARPGRRALDLGRSEAPERDCAAWLAAKAKRRIGAGKKAASRAG